jgi:hypothetical protein
MREFEERFSREVGAVDTQGVDKIIETLRN